MNEFNCKVCGGDHLTGSCEEPMVFRPLTPEEKLSADAGYFDVPDVSQPVGDGEKTPVRTMIRPVVRTLSPEEKMVATRQAIIDAKIKLRETVRENEESKRAEEIFRAVGEGDEDTIASLINRQFGSREFASLGEFQDQLIQFIQGSEEHSEVLNLKDLNKPTVYDSKMTIIFRPRIGGSSPFLEITIGNRSNLGKSRGEKQTQFIDMQVQQRSVQRPPREEFKKTGIIKMVRGWFGGKDE